ncbi:MAG: hypothetical protein GY929_26605 [Actinomycetia bacterium]|nr:hypothetical protein [Actinomycetes bacterium]
MSDPKPGVPRPSGLFILGAALILVPSLAFGASEFDDARKPPAAVATVTPLAVPPEILAALGTNAEAPDLIVTIAPTSITPVAPDDSALVTALPSAAPGPTPAGSDPGRRGREALALVPFDWQAHLPSWRIDFGPSREDAVGFTWSRERRIEIFVPEDASVGFLAHVIAHELGHAVDVELNSPDDRLRWQEARGITGTAWWAASGSSDFNSGAGDFAESFAAWLVGPERFASQLGEPPTIQQLALLAELSGG